MGDLSEHFSRHEFACKCGCGGDTLDAATLEALENIREHFGKPVTITSAYRCLMYNTEVGSNDNSQHPRGRAADIKVKGAAPNKVYAYADSLGLGGVGGYNNFTHIDTRTGQQARWFG